MLMFVPLSPSELVDWARGGSRDVEGFAATPGFRAAFQITDPVAEETELTLLEIGGIDGLIRHGVRLVAVCDVAPTTLAAQGTSGADFGAVTASAVAWTQVRSLFTDDDYGAVRASTMRANLTAVPLADAWDTESVQTLIAETDLLWHGSGEWDRLPN